MGEIESVKDNLKLLNDSLEELHQAWHDTRKDVDRRELEIEELISMEQEETDKIKRVNTQKEYEALKHEIADIRQKQDECEKHLLASWNKLDSAKKEYEQQGEICKQKTEAEQSQIAEKEIVANKLRDDLAEKYKHRDEKAKTVPEEWLQKYAVMRNTVKNPVVRVVDNSCGACFCGLTPQDSIAVKHRKLVLCKACFRLLYVMPETEEV